MPTSKSKKLPAPEHIYRKLIENMNEGVWMGDKDERTVYANPKFCQMTEYALDEMIGRKSYEFWDRESRARVREVNMTKRKKGIASTYEGNLVSKSGKIIPVLLSGAPLADGGTIGFITDITDLKNKEEQARILESAVQYSTDAIIIFNAAGEIISWNKGAKILFGFKEEELVGKKIDRIFPEDEIMPLLKYNRVFYNTELVGIHKSKKPVNISATLTPVFSGDQRRKTHAQFWLLIARDITSWIKMEKELSSKYQKIREAYNNFGVIRRQMEYIFDLLDYLKKTKDKKSIADFIVSSIIMLTRVDACMLRTYNARKNTLDLLSCFGVSKEWMGRSSIKLKNSLAEIAYKNNAPLKVIDIAQDPRHHAKSLASRSNLSSLLLIPLQFKGKLVGSLSMYVGPEKKLEIFENEFIEKYASLLELVVSTLN